MALLTRYPILVWAGAALLGWIAGELIVDRAGPAAYGCMRWRAYLRREHEVRSPQLRGHRRLHRAGRSAGSHSQGRRDEAAARWPSERVPSNGACRVAWRSRRAANAAGVAVGSLGAARLRSSARARGRVSSRARPRAAPWAAAPGTTSRTSGRARAARRTETAMALRGFSRPMTIMKAKMKMRRGDVDAKPGTSTGPSDAADQADEHEARDQHRQHAAERPQRRRRSRPRRGRAGRCDQVDQAGDAEHDGNVEREIAGRRALALAPVEADARCCRR